MVDELRKQGMSRAEIIKAIGQIQNIGEVEAEFYYEISVGNIDGDIQEIDKDGKGALARESLSIFGVKG